MYYNYSISSPTPQPVFCCLSFSSVFFHAILPPAFPHEVQENSSFNPPCTCPFHPVWFPPGGPFPLLFTWWTPHHPSSGASLHKQSNRTKLYGQTFLLDGMGTWYCREEGWEGSSVVVADGRDQKLLLLQWVTDTKRAEKWLSQRSAGQDGWPCCCGGQLRGRSRRTSKWNVAMSQGESQAVI